MAINDIQSTTVFVSDPTLALDFYVTKLGFELRTDQPFGPDAGFRWIEVAPYGASTVLILAHGFGGWTPEKVGVFTGIIFSTDSVDVTYEELSSRGVQFIETPRPQTSGIRQAQFSDLDGNIFVLVGE
jgi:lactoylglutathione lyase